MTALVDLAAGDYVEAMAAMVAASGSLVVEVDGATIPVRFGMVYVGE